MQYQSNSGSSISRNVTRALLMLLFLSFTVCYIHYMQCNFIALTQHILSEGHTHYSRLVGTVAITICAVAIQIGVSRLFRLPTLVYAVSYVPSALFLAAITDLIPDFSLFKLAVYILILVVCVSFCIYRQQRSLQRQRNHTFINAAISNTIIMTAIMLFTGFAGDTKRIMHYELNAEYYLDSNNFDKALGVGAKSSETSQTLTVLRAYALAKKNQLNEKLFEYPIPGGITALLPALGDSVKMIFNPKKIYYFLGAMPYPRTTPEQFLNTISAQPELVKARPQILEYKLATLLLNKQIDKFAATIKKAQSDSLKSNDLQKHCREALVLYQHLRTKPVITIRDNLTETNYNDFIEMMHATPNPRANANALQSQYGDTYWWYYYFVKTPNNKQQQ